MFCEAWHILEHDFYCTPHEDKQMTYAAVRGVLSTLEDPNTVLVEPKPRELEKADLKGEFGGIGAYVSMDAEGTVVLTPINDTPADRAGILTGDILIKVDDTELTPEMSIDDVVLLIRGPIGSMVKLTVRRESKSEPLVFEFELSKIPDDSSLSVKLYETADERSLVGTLSKDEDYSYVASRNVLRFELDQVPPSESYIVAEYRVLADSAVVSDEEEDE